VVLHAPNCRNGLTAAPGRGPPVNALFRSRGRIGSVAGGIGSVAGGIGSVAGGSVASRAVSPIDPTPERPVAYRGLLIDWGGVLTTDLFASFGAFCEDEGLQPDWLRTRFATDRETRALLIGLETGRLAPEAFELELGTALGVDPTDLIDRLFARVQHDDAMVAAVSRIREAGVRTGLISNSWGSRHYDRSLLDRLFDGVVISGEEDMRKPAPAMYSLGAERAGIAPTEAVYVDDLPFNLEPAAALGMATVHHVTAERTIAELERLFGISLG
jgi:putative hydrolase of the HAD superfamily